MGALGVKPKQLAPVFFAFLSYSSPCMVSAVREGKKERASMSSGLRYSAGRIHRQAGRAEPGEL